MLCMWYVIFNIKRNIHFVKQHLSHLRKRNKHNSQSPSAINHCCHAESAGCTWSSMLHRHSLYQKILGDCKNAGWHGSWIWLSITRLKWRLWHLGPFTTTTTPFPHSVSPPHAVTLRWRAAGVKTPSATELLTLNEPCLRALEDFIFSVASESPAAGWSPVACTAHLESNLN